MQSPLWSVAILVGMLAGMLGLRSFSKRIRLLFDVLCLAILSTALHQTGTSPFSPGVGPINGTTVWPHAIAVAWWLICARVVVAVLYVALHHDSRSREDRLLFDLAAAAIYVGTGLVVLKAVLALPVGGLVATSGIAAIVIGLALQNTLADVFAGIAVGIEAPFQVGDRIQLGKNIEGQVVETNWRSIRIQTDGADIAVVPNSVVAKLEIVNRSVPSRMRTVSIDLWCPAAADMDRTVDVLKQATLLCPAILSEPAPSVTLSRCGPSWHNYSISFSVPDTKFVSATKSLLLRQAHNQLRHAGLLAQRRKNSPRSRGRRITVLPPRQILREVVLFESLADEQVEHLATQVSTQLLEPGEPLFLQGAADCTLYVVASGIVEAVKTRDAGDNVPLGRIGAGEYVGEIGLLTGAPHAATARALTHCHVYRLSRDAIAPLLSQHAEIAAAFDRSARRGLDLLERSVAAAAAENMPDGRQLLHRIRVFFGFYGAR